MRSEQGMRSGWRFSLAWQAGRNVGLGVDRNIYKHPKLLLDLQSLAHDTALGIGLHLSSVSLMYERIYFRVTYSKALWSRERMVKVTTTETLQKQNQNNRAN